MNSNLTIQNIEEYVRSISIANHSSLCEEKRRLFSKMRKNKSQYVVGAFSALKQVRIPYVTGRGI